MAAHGLKVCTSHSAQGLPRLARGEGNRRASLRTLAIANVKVSKTEMRTLNITGDTLHPEWNYTIKPREL